MDSGVTGNYTKRDIITKLRKFQDTDHNIDML